MPFAWMMKKAVIVDDARSKFIIDKSKLLDWDPKDYPENDITSQQSPRWCAEY